jgi:hypothetical protein
VISTQPNLAPETTASKVIVSFKISSKFNNFYFPTSMYSEVHYSLIIEHFQDHNLKEVEVLGENTQPIIEHYQDKNLKESELLPRDSQPISVRSHQQRLVPRPNFNFFFKVLFFNRPCIPEK